MLQINIILLYVLYLTGLGGNRGPTANVCPSASKKVNPAMHHHSLLWLITLTTAAGSASSPPSILQHLQTSRVDNTKLKPSNSWGLWWKKVCGRGECLNLPRLHRNTNWLWSSEQQTFWRTLFNMMSIPDTPNTYANKDSHARQTQTSAT